MKQQESSPPVPIFEVLDETGRPFASRLQAIFRPLQIRFRRHFLSIRDDAIIHNLLDRAGQSLSRKLESGGQIDHPEALAWRILQNLAVSELRRSEEIVSNRSVGGSTGERTLLATASSMETAEEIHARIHANQLYSQMSEKERLCAVLKTAGYTSAGVAKALSMTPSGVDKMMQRVRDRIRNAIQEGLQLRGRLRVLRVTGPKSQGGH
jgi:DNA-directed RNA polymerase specialized sigma24 family protein